MVGALLAATVLAGPTHAATVSVQDGVLTYTAGPGENNEVEIFPDLAPNSVFVYEYVADVTPGPGCAPVPDPLGLPDLSVSYTCAGVTDGAAVDLGDNDDFAIIYTPGDTPIQVQAGDGNDFVGLGDGKDTVDGGAGADSIYGGLGEDTVIGGEGDDRAHGDYGTDRGGEEGGEGAPILGDADTVDGGPGDDRLMGDGGADALAGGPGVDSVDYSGRATPIVFSLDGAPGDGAANEGDRVAADIEGVLTGSGDDTVTGSPGADVLATGSGDDTIDAGGGEDQVDAGAGADRLALRDGAADTVDCGEGRDEADGDDNDAAGGCEVLRTPGNPSGGPKPPTGGLPALVMPSGIEMRLNGRPRRGRLRLTGRLVLPAGTDPRLCAGGAVRVAVKAGRKRPKVTEVLGADCGFSTSLSVRVRKNTRAIVRASFSGTAFLAGAVSAPMKVTLRR